MSEVVNFDIEQLRRAVNLMERLHVEHVGCKVGEEWIEDYSALAADSVGELLTILEMLYDE